GIVVRRAVDAGLADRVRCTHVIRHSVATALINAGAPIADRRPAGTPEHRHDRDLREGQPTLAERRSAAVADRREEGGASVRARTQRRTTMVGRAKEYLRRRRALGFELESTGVVLLDFARFAES